MESVSRTTLERIAVGFAILFGFGGLFFLCLVVWAPDRALYSWSNSDSEIRIYIEDRGFHGPNVTRLKVTHRGQTLADRSLGRTSSHTPESYHFEQVATDDGQLVCVSWRDLRTGVELELVIVDFAAGECWPLTFATELTPELLARWKKRYQLLRKEHPHLPEVPYFDPPTTP